MGASILRLKPSPALTPRDEPEQHSPDELQQRAFSRFIGAVQHRGGSLQPESPVPQGTEALHPDFVDSHLRSPLA